MKKATQARGEQDCAFDNSPLSRYIRGMAIDPLTRRSIDLFLAGVRTRYPVVEAWLYGSRARGDAREDSDVDLALVIDGEMQSASSVAADMGNETYEVLNETGQYVSPLPIRLALWREPTQHSNPFLLANIRREGVGVSSDQRPPPTSPTV